MISGGEKNGMRLYIETDGPFLIIGLVLITGHFQVPS